MQLERVKRSQILFLVVSNLVTRKSSEEFFFLHENDFVYKPERLPDDLKSLINDLDCLINSSGSFLESGDKGFLVNCLVSISNLLEEKHI